MGLDMYLYARRFIPDPEQPTVLFTANTCLADLRKLRDNDEDGGIYLSRWSFEKDAVREFAEKVVDVAGLLDLTVPSSSSSLIGVDSNDRLYVQTTCMYWRKANAIHGWFVNNCQDGVDECQESYVHSEKLAELQDTCKRAMDAYDVNTSKAASILPPTSGFFFGSAEMDEYYLADIKGTRERIPEVFKAAIEAGNVEFFYRASW